MKDSTDLWSHWSDPVEFVAGKPLSTTPVQDFLRITEIMYHPRGDSGYEYIELKNIGPAPIDLADVSFRDGIRFSFADGDLTTLDPGQFVVVVENPLVFETCYDTKGILIAGEYSGRLSNGGENIELVQGKSLLIQSFEFDDSWYPETDGKGHALIIQDAAASLESWSFREGWRPSFEIDGSPGTDDTESPAGFQVAGDIQQDGTLNITDAIILLRHLFYGTPSALPCGDGTPEDEANRRLLDLNDDSTVDTSDGVYLLDYLFLRGSRPAQGQGCVKVAGCPNVCLP
jgi:hypothetical protein